MLLKQPTKSFCILKGSQRLHFLNADRKSLLLTFVYGAVSMYTTALRRQGGHRLTCPENIKIKV